MNPKNRGLGKGLGALLDKNTTTPTLGFEEQETVLKIPVSAICPNPYQPRQDFPQETILELANSIAEQGLLQPILVRPTNIAGTYELIAGERRLRAVTSLSWGTIPAIVRPLSDKESCAIALVENLQRENLNPIDQATAIQQLKNLYDINQEDLSKHLGKSRSAIANMLRLLNLTPIVQTALRENKISTGHARALLSFPTAKLQEDALAMIIEKGLNVRQIENLAQKKDKNLDSSQVQKTSYKDFKKDILTKINMMTNQKFDLKIQGKPEIGAITITYKNPDELKEILNLFQKKENFK